MRREAPERYPGQSQLQIHPGYRERFASLIRATARYAGNAFSTNRTQYDEPNGIA
ncbi:hypothetical protein GJW-30_1_03198 [Variibacter gotjawalensis]|uniref:Uncharacterized protein n=1 Tax=Variibacter gotjawalensis TaxID=1333996 RepID=A0A0S3PXI2_9BRAD|nr:hypothetical protein [Variibacter gotjawalensis]RZS48391.1 hypothetical protein EV661_0802 [Variibacter gotjawalensis]BAT60650.1 hypothetical protein GJW-30_1_03198 [Variibacter gotjawalensis]